MFGEAIEIMIITEPEIALLQGTIQSGAILSIFGASLLQYIGHGYARKIVLPVSEEIDSINICFTVENALCSIEVAAKEGSKLKAICEKNNFLNSHHSVYSIVDRKLISKIVTKDIVEALSEKVAAQLQKF